MFKNNNNNFQNFMLGSITVRITMQWRFNRGYDSKFYETILKFQLTFSLLLLLLLLLFLKNSRVFVAVRKWKGDIA